MNAYIMVPAVESTETVRDSTLEVVLKAIGKLLAVAGGCSILSASTMATVIFNLDTTINGSTPTGTPPYLSAEFLTIGTDTGQLTMRNLMPDTNFVDNWLFNLEPVETLVFSYVSGVAAITATSGSNFSNGGSNMKAGMFDVEFHFPNSNSDPNRFHGGHTSVYRITGTGITESSFVSRSVPEGHNEGGYYSAAHVQGFGTSGLDSGSIAAVPEPVSGLAAMSIALIASWRRRKV